VKKFGCGVDEMGRRQWSDTRGEAMFGAWTRGVGANNRVWGRMVELGAQFIGAEEVTGGVPRGPSMADFNSRVIGVEEEGSAPVAEWEKERRPSCTDSRTEELAEGSPGGYDAGIKRRQRCCAPWTEGRRRLHGPWLGWLGQWAGNFA
jgi:hypothetical protein